MVNIIISPAKDIEQFFSLTIGIQKPIQHKFSDLDSNSTLLLNNLVSLLQTSESNMFTLTNFNNTENIELLIYLNDYLFDKSSVFNFSNFSMEQKLICEDFLNHYLVK